MQSELPRRSSLLSWAPCAGPSSRQTRHSQLLACATPSGPPHPGPELNADQRLALGVIRAERAVLAAAAQDEELRRRWRGQPVSRHPASARWHRTAGNRPGDLGREIIPA